MTESHDAMMLRTEERIQQTRERVVKNWGILGIDPEDPIVELYRRTGDRSAYEVIDGRIEEKLRLRR